MTLTITLKQFVEGRVEPVAGGTLVADLSGLTGFAVDSLAIPVYKDGFNIFAPSGQSLNALVEFDRLFFAPGKLGEPGSPRSLEALLHMSEATADGTPAD